MISVALATYNGELYLKKQLISIIEQSMPVDEIVIVDDCSTDNTIEIINDVKKNTSVDIHLFKNKKNIGYKKIFHKAISLCKGDYIFLCDQDDLWYKDKVALMMNVMLNNPLINVLSTSFEIIDENDNVINNKLRKNKANNNLIDRTLIKDSINKMTIEDVFFSNISQGCSMLLTRYFANKFLDFYDFALPHDWFINLLAADMNSLYFYNKILFKYRIHSNNTIGFKDKQTIQDKITLENRLLQAKTILLVIDTLKHLNIETVNLNNINEIKEFMEKHIYYVEHKKIIHILMQNFSPFYSKIKSKKSRLLDLYYCMVRENK